MQGPPLPEETTESFAVARSSSLGASSFSSSSKYNADLSMPPHVSAARSSKEDNSSAVTSLSAGKAFATRTTSVPRRKSSTTNGRTPRTISEPL